MAIPQEEARSRHSSALFEEEDFTTLAQQKYASLYVPNRRANKLSFIVANVVSTSVVH